MLISSLDIETQHTVYTSVNFIQSLLEMFNFYFVCIHVFMYVYIYTYIHIYIYMLKYFKF